MGMFFKDNQDEWPHDKPPAETLCVHDYDKTEVRIESVDVLACYSKCLKCGSNRKDIYVWKSTIED